MREMRRRLRRLELIECYPTIVDVENEIANLLYQIASRQPSPYVEYTMTRDQIRCVDGAAHKLIELLQFAHDRRGWQLKYYKDISVKMLKDI